MIIIVLIFIMSIVIIGVVLVIKVPRLDQAGGEGHERLGAFSGGLSGSRVCRVCIGLS